MPEKYQDEIEEILKGIEDDEPPRPARRAQPIIDDQPRPIAEESPRSRDQRQSGTGTKSRWRSVTPGKMALAGFVVLVLGLALSPIGLGWLAWLGLIGLAAAYLLFFVRPRAVNQGKGWRGRSIESQGPSPWQRFRRWLDD